MVQQTSALCLKCPVDIFQSTCARQSEKKRIFSVAVRMFFLFIFVFLCVVPDDHASALCGRSLQPVELHELPAVAVHRCGGAGFNLPPIHKT